VLVPSPPALFEVRMTEAGKVMAWGGLETFPKSTSKGPFRGYFGNRCAATGVFYMQGSGKSQVWAENGGKKKHTHRSGSANHMLASVESTQENGWLILQQIRMGEGVWAPHFQLMAVGMHRVTPRPSGSFVENKLEKKILFLSNNDRYGMNYLIQGQT